MVSKFKKQITYKKFYRTKDNVKFDVNMQDKLRPYLELRNDIEEEKKEIKDKHKKIILPSQSKMLLIFLFINFTLLELFIGYISIKTLIVALAIGMMPDFTPLVTLIGIIAGETISYGIYASKSKAENTEGGIIYSTTMFNLKQKGNEDGTFG